MAATPAVEIKGYQDVVYALKAAPVEMRKQLIVAVVRSKQELLKRIVAAAPKRTGSLSRAIEVTKSKSLTGFIGINDGAAAIGGVGAVRVLPRRPEIYWRFVEFGSVRGAAQPFIRPQADAYESAFLSHVKDAALQTARILSQAGRARTVATVGGRFL